MAVIGERQVTGENGGIFQNEKSRSGLNMEGFWLCDNCRIGADNIPSPSSPPSKGREPEDEA
jgi:hypothetical protein